MPEQKGEGSDSTCFKKKILGNQAFYLFFNNNNKMLLSRRVELFCSVNADLTFCVLKTKGSQTFCFEKNPSTPLVLTLRQYPVWRGASLRHWTHRDTEKVSRVSVVWLGCRI